jgi:tetratricopeptide (TPR) repeat protein
MSNAAPDTAETHASRGKMLIAKRQFAAAVISYDQAIALKPDFSEAHIQRGNALRKLGQFESAVSSYDRALALLPDHAETHCNRAIALKELRKFELAVTGYDRAIALNPAFLAAHANRGVALAALQQHEAAVASFDQANALHPGIAFTHLHRGISLHALGRHQAAVEAYQKVIALDASSSEAQHNLGLSLLQLRQHEAAIVSFDRAIALNPEFADAWASRGLALYETRQHQAAIANYEKAITLQPKLRIAHRNLSHLYLQLGDYEKGWEKFEWRMRSEENQPNRRSFTQPQWLGQESIAGKTILLHSEQGLGDTLQFCRYANEVAALGASVILEVQKPLISLLGSLNGVTTLLPKMSVLPPFDLHCPLMSLPLARQARIDNIPSAAGYLKADTGKVSEWKTRLGSKTRPRIGLVWSGNPLHKNDQNRSIPLADFIKLLSDDFEFVCLQKEVKPADQETLAAHPEIRRFGAELNDFSDTAALCELLDLVISVDTSVAHLAGALGRPVWILLPFNPDWRWLLERQDSPWYASVRLYRGDRLAGWSELMTRVRADLALLQKTS